MARILVVDNYDSFVFNLVQYLEQLGASCEVRRNDAMTVADVEADVEAGGYDGILLSPGPGVPADAGICEDLIRWAAGRVPVLGVCLGHQAIAEVYGATVGRAEELLHGRTSQVHHDGAGLFEGLPDPLTVTRYHSLAVVDGTVPDELVVTARTVADGEPADGGAADGAGGAGGCGARPGVIMGLRHREHAVQGVQFHPESVLTQGGHRLLANWLADCGYHEALERVLPLETEVERLRLSAV